MLSDSSKQGLYYSDHSTPDALTELTPEISFKAVSNLHSLKSALHSEIFDFLIIDLEDLAQFLKVIQTAHKMDQDLIMMTTHHFDFPRIHFLHYLRRERLVQDVMEVLSFEQARANNGLQTVYSEFVERGGHDHFYLIEHSPMGIVLTDEEDRIFYVNEAAKMLLNYDESRKFLHENLILNSQFKNRNHERISTVDQVAVRGSKTSVSLIIKEISNEKEKVGSIVFLDDVTDIHESSRRLEREKVKFEKLTGRLNDLILKGADSRIYNETYMRRKIDLEIRHSHRMQSEYGVCLIYIKSYEKLFNSSAQQKAFLSKMSDLLAEKFSDSFIVGVLAPGVWVAFSTSALTAEDLELAQFQSHALECLKGDIISTSDLKIEYKLLDNLTSYKSTDDLLESL